MPTPNRFKFVMLPPQSATTRDWAAKLAEQVPEVRVVVADDADTAAREIVDAEAAFGWLHRELLAKAASCAGCRRRRPRHPPGITIRR